MEQGDGTGIFLESFRPVLGALKIRLMNPDLGLEAPGAQGAQEA